MRTTTATELRKCIEKLNEKVEELAVAVDAEFIKTKDIFTLANGAPNDGYFLQDGVHLNLRGSTKLVERLQLPLKKPQGGKSRKRQRTTHSHCSHRNQIHINKNNLNIPTARRQILLPSNTVLFGTAISPRQPGATTRKAVRRQGKSAEGHA